MDIRMTELMSQNQDNPTRIYLLCRQTITQMYRHAYTALIDCHSFIVLSIVTEL